jgi:hypothetical protein
MTSAVITESTIPHDRIHHRHRATSGQQAAEKRAAKLTEHLTGYVIPVIAGYDPATINIDDKAKGFNIIWSNPREVTSTGQYLQVHLRIEHISRSHQFRAEVHYETADGLFHTITIGSRSPLTRRLTLAVQGGQARFSMQRFDEFIVDVLYALRGLASTEFRPYMLVSEEEFRTSVRQFCGDGPQVLAGGR